jgi:hypothetical protein
VIRKAANRAVLKMDNGDGTTSELCIRVKGPTVHLRMASETAEQWLVRLGDLLSRPGAKAVRSSTGAVIAVEIPA